LGPSWFAVGFLGVFPIAVGRAARGTVIGLTVLCRAGVTCKSDLVLMMSSYIAAGWHKFF